MNQYIKKRVFGWWGKEVLKRGDQKHGHNEKYLRHSFNLYGTFMIIGKIIQILTTIFF